MIRVCHSLKAELLLISNQNEKMILNFQNGYIYPDINSANKIDASFKKLTHSIERNNPQVIHFLSQNCLITRIDLILYRINGMPAYH